MAINQILKKDLTDNRFKYDRANLSSARQAQTVELDDAVDVAAASESDQFAADVDASRHSSPSGTVAVALLCCCWMEPT